jgi:hypothetical protein
VEEEVEDLIMDGLEVLEVAEVVVLVMDNYLCKQMKYIL